MIDLPPGFQIDQQVIEGGVGAPIGGKLLGIVGVGEPRVVGVSLLHCLVQGRQASLTKALAHRDRGNVGYGLVAGIPLDGWKSGRCDSGEYVAIGIRCEFRREWENDFGLHGRSISYLDALVRDGPQGAAGISLADFHIPDAIRPGIIDDVDPEGKGAISRRYSESAVDLYGRIAELRINVPQELRLCRGRVDEDSGQDE